MLALSSVETLGVVTGVLSGVGGLCLGIYNTIHAIRQTRPRLVVAPLLRHIASETAGVPNEPEMNVGIVQVRNVGQQCVTVEKVVVSVAGSGDGLFVSKAVVVETEQYLPHELDPGKRISVRFDVASLLKESERTESHPTRFAVCSVVGDRFECSRRAMKSFMADFKEYKAKFADAEAAQEGEV